MKMVPLASENMQEQTSETLQTLLLNLVMKVKKINKEMNDNIHVQRAQDTLDLARSPFKRVKARWSSEIEAIELELKSRNIKFTICTGDEIYDSEEYNE